MGGKERRGGFIYMPKQSRNRNNIFRTAAVLPIGSNSLSSAYFFDRNRSFTTYVIAYLVVFTVNPMYICRE